MSKRNNNGNMTARGNDSFSWDGADRLTSATVGGTTTTFAYNGDGLRDSFTTGGVTTTSTWDIAGGLPQELYDGSLSYVYGIGRVAEVDGSGNTYYYLPDALGSTMALVDSSGTVADAYNYDVFGAIRSSSGSQANPFTYTGERTEASTGLEYLRARYYDPAVGSFISRDPVPFVNRYSYAQGNPVVFSDPSGLCVSQATHDKFMAARNPFQAGEVHNWYQKIIAMWQNQPVCGLGGSSAGGDGLHCGWTTDCSNGRGCDYTVVDRPSDPHPDSCWHDTGPNAPSIADDPINYGTTAKGKSCKGLKCKIQEFLLNPCNSAAVSFASGAVSLIPYVGPPVSAEVSAFQAGFEAGRGAWASAVANGASGLTSAAATLNVPGVSNGVSAAASAASGVPSLISCIKGAVN